MQLAGYCGSGNSLEDAIAEFAERYAEQTHHDYNALKRAIKSGKIKAALNSKTSVARAERIGAP